MRASYEDRHSAALGSKAVPSAAAGGSAIVRTASNAKIFGGPSLCGMSDMQ